MRRPPVDGDIWMPTRLSLNGRGRAAVVQTLMLDFVVDWSDYRRLDGSLTTPLLD